MNYRFVLNKKSHQTSQRHSCDNVTFLAESTHKHYCNTLYINILQSYTLHFSLQMSHRHSCDAVTFCCLFLLSFQTLSRHHISAVCSLQPCCLQPPTMPFAASNHAICSLQPCRLQPPNLPFAASNHAVTTTSSVPLAITLHYDWQLVQEQKWGNL